MRGGPDFIALMLRVYAIETEAAELRATTISLRKGTDDSSHSLRGHEDSWNRPSQPDKKLVEELAAASARCVSKNRPSRSTGKRERTRPPRSDLHARVGHRAWSRSCCGPRTRSAPCSSSWRRPGGRPRRCGPT